MTRFIISQILGLIALALVCIGYFFKKKSSFLLIQLAANIFYGAAFIVQQSYVAGFITLLSISRTVYLYICNIKNFKYTAYFLPIFIAGYAILGGLFWQSWLDIIPIITATLFTIAFYVKDQQYTRFLCLFPNLILIFYGIICKTYSNALLDFIEATVVVSSLIKFYFDAKKNIMIQKKGGEN